MPLVNVFERINSEYYQLTSAEKKVADYAVIHQQQTQFMSISELAEEAGVAEATISRFCKRLGYKGYSAFKLAIANATAGRMDHSASGEEEEEEDSVEGMCRAVYRSDSEALAQTLELIQADAVRKAADMIVSAGRVLCMGQGGSMILSQECAHLFSTIQLNFTAVMDSHLQAIAASQLTPGDLVIYFSYSGSTKELMKNLQIIRDRKARIILVTRFPKSPAATLADVVLRCGSNEGPFQFGSVPARIAQLVVIDVLFQEYYHRNQKSCEENIQSIASALSGMHV